MSLLSDGIHRRAPLTARVGAARCGAARVGCVYGQNDLAGLTREIKNQALTDEGPFYIWRERLPIDFPFGGLHQFIEEADAAALLLGIEGDVTFVTSSNLLLGITGFVHYDPVMPALLLLSLEGDISFIAGNSPSSEQSALSPDPLAPNSEGGRRIRQMRGY